MSHVDEGTLHALVDNALDASERLAVEGHLATCGDCARRRAKATAMARQVVTLLGALDDVPTRVRVVPPVVAAADGATTAVTPLRLRVFTLRRVAIAASLLMVAGVSYEVGSRRDAREANAPAANTAMNAAPRVATPSVVEATGDSIVAMPQSALRQRVPSGPRLESGATLADRGEARSATSAAEPIPLPLPIPAQPMSAKALSMPLPSVAIADVARDSVAERAAAAKAGAEALGRVQVREASGGQGTSRTADLATRMRNAPLRLESVVVTGMTEPRAPATPAPTANSGASAKSATPRVVTLPGYVTTDEESVPATTRRRYMSSSGTALTLLIVHASADARRHAAATEFTVTTLEGRSIVRWHARGVDYELQGALAPDSLVKLATQLK